MEHPQEERRRDDQAYQSNRGEPRVDGEGAGEDLELRHETGERGKPETGEGRHDG